MTEKRPASSVPPDEQWRLDRLSDENLSLYYLVSPDNIKRIANGKRVHGVSQKTYDEIRKRLKYRDKLRSQLQKRS